MTFSCHRQRWLYLHAEKNRDVSKTALSRAYLMPLIKLQYFPASFLHCSSDASGSHLISFDVFQQWQFMYDCRAYLYMGWCPTWGLYLIATQLVSIPAVVVPDFTIIEDPPPFCLYQNWKENDPHPLCCLFKIHANDIFQLGFPVGLSSSCLCVSSSSLFCMMHACSSLVLLTRYSIYLGPGIA
jgi:hypothetical protein